MKYAFIATQRQHFTIALMCRLLGVSRAGFYAARKRQPSARTLADQRLRVHIRAVHRQSRQTYGSPRVHAELRDQGVRCGRKRIERLMRIEGLTAKPRRRQRHTTNSTHAHPVVANVLARQFAVTDVAGLNCVWVGDITYVPTREGWLYLAVLLDLASRSVVGWAMQPTLDQSLTHHALQMAVLRRRPSAGLLHHSDRGVQYAAINYQALLTRHGLRPSMSRKGDCYDNAVAESFFATLEWELIQSADWHTRAEAKAAIFEYLEVWYNQQRRHSALGYLSPAEYERRLVSMARAA